jgi:asparagine synthase (glutamine-hydrolysing)
VCGVVGVVSTIEIGHDDRARVQAACDELTHRGPDAEGVWESPHAALGHRRLRILDLTGGSDQPIADRTGQWILSYNGEIYNFLELEPGAPGDTLALISGEPLALTPERLRGMFAYALVKSDAHEVHLVRDRFGMKPLYFRATSDRLEFGSTAGAVGRMSERNAVDALAVRSFIRYGSVSGPRSIYEGVHEVPPGSTLMWDGSGARSQIFAEAIPDRGSRGTLKEVLADSVGVHSVSDVPLAVFLSGGIDSTVIATLAAGQGQDLTAFTVGFPGKAFDETEAARATAQALGIRHVVVDRVGSPPDFDRFFASMDQPSVDGLNTWIVCGAAAEAGFKVALSGLGADELFCGYSITRRALALQTMNTLVPLKMRSLLLGGRGPNALKAASLGNAGRQLTPIYDELRSIFTADETARLTGGTSATPQVSSPWHSGVSAIMRMELEGYLRNTLLRDADTYSMAHSVELRTPFVDEHVVSAAMAIPDAARLLMRKQLLVRAVGTRRLREIARRKKMGFTLDYAGWLTNELADRVGELTAGPLQDVLDGDAVRDHVARWNRDTVGVMKIWSLVVLDAWLRRESAVT